MRVYLQKIGLKEKIKQVEEQKLGSKVDVEKVKVEQIEEQKVSSKANMQKVKLEGINIRHTSWNYRPNF